MREKRKKCQENDKALDVNFTNILNPFLLHESSMFTYLYLKFDLLLFRPEKIGAKATLKMLVK